MQSNERERERAVSSPPPQPRPSPRSRVDPEPPPPEESIVRKLLCWVCLSFSADFDSPSVRPSVVARCHWGKHWQRPETIHGRKPCERAVHSIATSAIGAVSPVELTCTFPPGATHPACPTAWCLPACLPATERLAARVGPLSVASFGRGSVRPRRLLTPPPSVSYQDLLAQTVSRERHFSGRKKQKRERERKGARTGEMLHSVGVRSGREREQCVE